jgi:hypothetical protein
MKLTKLQDDLILTMCNLEIIFPPSFFDLQPPLTRSYYARDKIPGSCVSSLDVSI